MQTHKHHKKEKHNLIRHSLIVSLFVAIISLLFAGNVKSVPQGPDVINISSSGRNSQDTSSVRVDAKAGNVTALVIDGTRVTFAWQGYYGNVTGTIALDDANNFTLYDWDLPDPAGEVYASNASNVAWISVYCINVSQEGANPLRPDGSVSNINGTQIELNYGINNTDTDGLNETFNDTFTSAFKVGSITIDSTDGCSSTHPFTDENHNTDWVEVILSDNSSIIFTSILRSNANGFKPGSSDAMDFQMLVLENGHFGSESTTTPYYFFVELT